jgi:hypothetical protein
MARDQELIEEFEQLKPECEKHLKHFEANPKLRLIEKSADQVDEVDVTEREDERDPQLIRECQRIIAALKSE